MCGDTPACTAARRTASARRRRTSDVDSRRPLLERNSAGSGSRLQRGAAALQVGLERAPRGLAGGHDPGAAALALHAQLLGVGVEAAPRRGSRAPRRAGRPSSAARRSRGRAARAAWRRACAPAASPTSAGLSTVGRCGVALGRGRTRSAGLASIVAGAHQLRGRTTADRGQLARDGGSCDAPRSDSTPAKRRSARWSSCSGAEVVRARPTRPAGPGRRRRRGGSSRPCPGARSAASKPRRAAPQLGFDHRGVGVLRQHSGRAGGHAQRQLAEAGLRRRRRTSRSLPWHPIQGPSDASTMWYAVLRKRERGVFIGTLCIRHIGPPSLPGGGRAGRRCPWSRSASEPLSAM